MRSRGAWTEAESRTKSGTAGVGAQSKVCCGGVGGETGEPILEVSYVFAESGSSGGTV